MPSLEILCSVIEHGYVPLAKPFTRHPRNTGGAHNALTMYRGEAESIATIIVAANAMDQC